jgi:hypothetical protein
MTRHVMLNNVAHKDLRVITRHGAEFGDAVGSVMTFPTEYADVQREYPIFFRRATDTGEYHSVALLGLDKDENVFLEDGRWNASYIPGIVARGPFLIGFQEQQVGGELRKEPVISVDLDHPRVSFTEGEAVFLPHGGNSPYLDQIATVLRGIRDGLEVSKAMFAAFTENGLIEPVQLEIKFGEQEKYNVVGLYTINVEKLRALGGSALEKLNRAGFLQGAFLVIASMQNVKKLVTLKQRRGAQRGTGA